MSPRDDRYFSTRYTYSEKRESVWPVLATYLAARFIPRDAAVLDIGAGYCHFINHVTARERHALDVSPVIEAHAAPGVVSHVASCTSMTMLADGYFDVVFASNLFEHLDREQFVAAVEEIRRVLKVGGALIVVQPNFRFCYRRYFDDYTHVQIFTDVGLADALRGWGFGIRTVVPRFLPFSVKSRLPVTPTLVRLYLRSPFRPFAGQMLLVAEKAADGRGE